MATLQVRLDPELDRALQHHAASAGISVSAAARDLLRRALGVVSSPYEAGWREGYVAAVGQVQETVQRAFASVTLDPRAARRAKKH